MSQPAIQVNGISKKYHIGSVKVGASTLQERLGAAVMGPFRRIAGLASGRAAAAADLTDEFWALQDVSFTINQGERVAIIGRNGAGKSTLLKILSRVTEPTSGSAVIRGRMGSLLEVGTGFHPELTGRENIFLNASILGMKKAEVDSKFDEIVAFSEVGKFINTPVKHYSSGMRVRLAFSVAAHLEPEVLIVDEVLSVGDVRFRKKCMDRIHKVAERGATVLVVSHNAQTVVSICDRAIWLEQGRIVEDGDAAPTVSKYMGQGMGLSAERRWLGDDRPGAAVARVNGIKLVTASGEITDCIDVREDFCVESDVEVLKPGHGLLLKHVLLNGEGTPAFSSVDVNNPVWEKRHWPVGRYTLRMWIPGNLLQVDNYSVDLVLWAWEPQQEVQCHLRSVLCFHTLDNMDGTSARGHFVGNLNGVVRPLLRWEMEPHSAVDGSACSRGGSKVVPAMRAP